MISKDHHHGQFLFFLIQKARHTCLTQLENCCNTNKTVLKIKVNHSTIILQGTFVGSCPHRGGWWPSLSLFQSTKENVPWAVTLNKTSSLENGTIHFIIFPSEYENRALVELHSIFFFRVFWLSVYWSLALPKLLNNRSSIWREITVERALRAGCIWTGRLKISVQV